MKKVLFLLLFVGLLCFPCHAEGKSYSSLLSPAISVLQEYYPMQKGAEIGSKITFSEKDFQNYLNEKDFQSITVDLPNSSKGNLKLYGKEVKAGDKIKRDDLDGLIYFTAISTQLEESFSFYYDDNTFPYYCKMVWSEYKSPDIQQTVRSIKTYRNIPLYDTLLGDNSVEITKACSAGIIQLDADSGDFCYRPQKNYTGRDSFCYVSVDNFGNRSAEKEVIITVKKAKNNLYFQDLENHRLHREAIELCEKGILSYILNSRGLPIFSGNGLLREDEFRAKVEVLLGEGSEIPVMNGQTSIGDNDDAEFLVSLNGKSIYTRYDLLSFAKKQKDEQDIFINQGEL